MYESAQRLVRLPAEQSTYVNDLVQTGGFQSIDAVVAAALRLFQEREAIIEQWLRKQVLPAYDLMRSSPRRGLSIEAIASVMHCTTPYLATASLASREVNFSPECLSDLRQIYGRLALDGRVWAAKNYVEVLLSYCVTLAEFPEFGKLRSDLKPHLYLGNYRRRAAISYHVTNSSAVIDRILFVGHNHLALFDDGEYE